MISFLTSMAPPVVTLPPMYVGGVVKLVGLFSYRDAEGRIRMPALMAARKRPR